VSAADDQPRRIGRLLLEESAEDLYEHAPCGYLSTYPDGTIARVNQTLVDWLGHDRAALLSMRFQALLTTGSRIYYETHYAPLLRMQGFVNQLALDVVCADGRQLPVLVNTRQRRDAAGEPLFNRITLFDSTDRRRYERELLLARRKAERAAKDKADLLAMLSHDIRNPLTVVMGTARMLNAGAVSDPQRQMMNLLDVSSANMLQLLDRILELSRLESGSVALCDTVFSVATLIADVVAVYEPSARDKGVSLRGVVDERVPARVSGDPIALRQVMTNLVDNAVKFTRAGRIDVTVRPIEIASDAVTLAFAVADTGIGIAAAAVERIFEEYTQATPDTHRRYGGTGLGLTITRRLLGLYGSKIGVATAPGQGTTFTFDLRLIVPPA
jgi:PAS domain S-box-containing protein